MRYYDCLHVLSKKQLAELELMAHERGYIPVCEEYLGVKVTDETALKDVARRMFLELSASYNDQFFMLRTWLRAFEIHLRLDKPFFFPHIDP